jgi:hypothetical protein
MADSCPLQLLAHLTGHGAAAERLRRRWLRRCLYDQDL